MAKTQTPNLILRDIQMPEMDRLEATRRIRFDGDRATIPMIAIASLAILVYREKCLVVGFNEYLTKPIALKKLNWIGSPTTLNIIKLREHLI